LQNTIYQFEHKTGVVEKIDEDTQQLVRALSQGTPIVITTIQKFPFISQALSTFERRGVGVKIDTAGKALRGHRRRSAFLAVRRDRYGSEGHAEQGRHRGGDCGPALR
jgi:type I site-specific restriction-modification system R (restriction) subunit